METLAGLDPHDRKQLEAVARLYRELGIEKKATEFRTRAKRARR